MHEIVGEVDVTMQALVRTGTLQPGIGTDVGGKAPTEPTACADGVVVDSLRRLAAYGRYLERIQASWPSSAVGRRERLQQGVFDAPVENVAENILADLFTAVLDWS